MVDGYSGYRSCSYSNNPSFSSTLLDKIYRSIDQGEEEVGIYGEPIMRKKQIYSFGGVVGGGGVFRSEEEEMANLQRACMIEKWMEKKVGGDRNGAGRRKSATDLPAKKSRKDSSSSSSDSSCGGGGGCFSETESFTRPKPIRTAVEKERIGGGGGDFEFSRRERRSYGGEEFERKPKHESGFLKTKSRALKIYGDLKKVKQPISPGGKLAGFLNSLFSSGGGGGSLKKSKIAAAESPSLKSSTCSSASSFSRSCLSKTPSSRGKPSTGAAKRSVRFSPVSVIVDEDCQPCGHKSLHNNDNNYNKKQQISNYDPAKNDNNVNRIKNVANEELMIHVMEKNRHVEQVARDLLRNYQRKTQDQFEFSRDNLRKSHMKSNKMSIDHDFDHEDEDEDDDAASYASSDLFELDNLSSIGMERYDEELPVYETTHLGTNRAIVNGLIL